METRKEAGGRTYVTLDQTAAEKANAFVAQQRCQLTHATQVIERLVISLAAKCRLCCCAVFNAASNPLCGARKLNWCIDPRKRLTSVCCNAECMS